MKTEQNEMTVNKWKGIEEQSNRIGFNGIKKKPRKWILIERVIQVSMQCIFRRFVDWLHDIRSKHILVAVRKNHWASIEFGSCLHTFFNR